MSPTPEEALIGYVYKITNRTNGLVYIGQTTYPLRQYFRQKIKLSLSVKNPKYRQALFDVIRKEGPENFECECIEVLPARELHAAEMRWIAHYKANDPAFGYNKTAGGKTVPEAIKMSRRGAKNSLTHIEQTRQGNLEYYKTHPGPWLGRKHKPESIELVTQKVREYYRTNPSSMKGRKHSPETIERMKLAAKNLWEKRKQDANSKQLIGRRTSRYRPRTS